MLLSTAAFSAMNICIREASGTLHTTVIVGLRNALTLLILLPLVLAQGPGFLRTKRLGGHAWRATIGVIGMQSWFYCITTLPLNQATALSFTAPLFTSLFAMVFLREKADIWRWAGLFAGFAGTVIILRPDPNAMQWDALIVMFTTSMWAIAGLMVKSLTRSEPPLRIIFYMSLFMLLWSLPAMLWYWRMPDLYHWMLLMMIALLSTIAHWSLVKAYALADVVKLMPFDFTRLLWTGLFAYVVFGETVDAMSWVGGAVILTSAAFLARRDAKAAPAG